jgi:molybdopterin converting factor subunit 1
MTTVSVRLYAGLRDAVGARDIELQLSERATVAELRETLASCHPLVRPFLPTLVYAVDEEYVTSEHVLRDGDHVAIIPPVSGG